MKSRSMNFVRPLKRLTNLAAKQRLQRALWINLLLLCTLIAAAVPANAASVSAPVAGHDVAQNPAPVAQEFTTTITVNTTSDPEDSSSNVSCTLDGNGARPAEDGLCSLRRAITEAGKRNLADRPILIAFDLPTDEENSVAGTWTLDVGSGLPSIVTLSAVAEPESLVTIDGSTQPGGRADGPAVFIKTAGPFTLSRNGNTLRNLGFYGGGTIAINQASSRERQGNNLVENVWMGLSEDGQSMVLEDEDNPNGLAGGGITINKSDGNIVRNSVIVGSTGRAISILTGDDNELSGNYVGTLADGTVPAVAEANQCTRSLLYDPSNWYGGWGIQVSGADNRVLNNIVAGMHQLQSANETPPMAIEVVNAENVLIQGNLIGVDSAGNEVGVCGIGISALGKTITSSGDSIKIVENTIVRSRKGFEEPESDSAIYLGGGTGITVQGNIVKDATENVIGFSAMVPDFWRNFEPAKITDLDGASVSGTSGLGSPCPNCIIELFLDNLNGKQEALEMVGTATADANGRWSTTLSKAVPDDMALRTTSTTQDIGVIGNLDLGTTSKMSGLQIPPTDILISGPTEGLAFVPYEFDYQILSDQVLTPLTVTVSATGLETWVGTLGKTDATAGVTWVTPGTKTLTIRAENCLGAVTRTHQIEIYGLIPETVAVSGPTIGALNQSYTFDIEITQPLVALPITLRTEITDKDPTETVFNETAFNVTTAWDTEGTKNLKFILSNGGDPVEIEHTIVIGNADNNPPDDSPPVDNPPVDDPPDDNPPVDDPTEDPTGTGSYKVFLPNIQG